MLRKGAVGRDVPRSIAIIARFDIKWPSQSKYLFFVFTLLLFDVDATSPTCVVNWPSANVYYTHAFGARRAALGDSREGR